MAFQAPFTWQMRLSKRARRVRMTIDMQGKVVLVWPHDLSQRHVTQVLQEHTPWVVKNLQAMSEKVRPHVQPPTHITLAALAQSFSVHYQVSLEPCKLVEHDHTLTISGDVADIEAVRQRLNIWLKKKGHQYLKPWLAQVATEMGVAYHDVSIRLQKTRWGSCSAKKRISLNAALLFLPDFLVRHVFVHELTHLKHLNHSSHFWQDVALFEPDFQKHGRLLKQYAKDVPLWLTQPFDVGFDKVVREDVS